MTPEEAVRVIKDPYSPLPLDFQTSLILVLYRWRDKFYDEKNLDLNDRGAVQAMRALFKEATQELKGDK